MLNEDILLAYVRDLTKKAGLDNVPEDFKAQMEEQMVAQVTHRLGLAVTAELDEKGLTDFVTLTEGEQEPAPEDVLVFFNSRLPDFPGSVERTLESYAKEYISGVNKLKGTKLDID